MTSVLGSQLTSLTFRLDFVFGPKLALRCGLDTTPQHRSHRRENVDLASVLTRLAAHWLISSLPVLIPLSLLSKQKLRGRHSIAEQSGKPILSSL